MPIAIVVLLGMLGVGISLLATSLWWLGLLLVGCAVWNAYVQVVCRRQVDIETAMSVDDAAAVIERLFGGRTWDLRRSDYDFRASNRLKLHSPTIAVHLEAHSGSTKVNVWVSNATFRYGLMHHAQFAWRKIRRLTGAFSSGRDGVPVASSRERERPVEAPISQAWAGPLVSTELHEPVQLKEQPSNRWNQEESSEHVGSTPDDGTASSDGGQSPQDASLSDSGFTTKNPPDLDRYFKLE